MRSNEAQRESRKKDKLERELKQSKADLDAKTSENRTMQTQMEKYKLEITKLEQQLKEQRVSTIMGSRTHPQKIVTSLVDIILGHG